jgi:hypothetical protein
MRRLPADKTNPPTPQPACADPTKYTLVPSGLNLDTNPVFDAKINMNGDGLLDNPTTTDGWNGTEYTGFLSIPMYNGGKNDDLPNTPAIGNAYLGYDCTTSKLCVAAYLNIATYFVGQNCQVVMSPDSSWVSINDENNKYKDTTASVVNFKYVKYPNGLESDRTIGK